MPAKHFDRGHGPLLQGLRDLVKNQKGLMNNGM